MINALVRILYFAGYRCARLVWRFTNPRINGALIAIWYEDNVLLVRNSYRTEWTFPGGGIDINEPPRTAAAREVREELGWTVPEEDLISAGELEMPYHNRIDKVHFFYTFTGNKPDITIDNKEIVEAKFFSPEEALLLKLTPHVKVFLRDGHLVNAKT